MAADVSSLRRELDEITAQENKLNQRKMELKDAIAKATAAFRVGDLVCTGRVDGVFVVESIRPSYDGSPRYFGSKLKKNGEPGQRVNHLWDWRGELRFATKEEIIAAGRSV